MTGRAALLPKVQDRKIEGQGAGAKLTTERIDIGFNVTYHFVSAVIKHRMNKLKRDNNADMLEMSSPMCLYVFRALHILQLLAEDTKRHTNSNLALAASLFVNFGDSVTDKDQALAKLADAAKSFSLVGKTEQQKQKLEDISEEIKKIIINFYSNPEDQSILRKADNIVRSGYFGFIISVYNALRDPTTSYGNSIKDIASSNEEWNKIKKMLKNDTATTSTGEFNVNDICDILRNRSDSFIFKLDFNKEEINAEEVKKYFLSATALGAGGVDLSKLVFVLEEAFDLAIEEFENLHRILSKIRDYDSSPFLQYLSCFLPNLISRG